MGVAHPGEETVWEYEDTIPLDADDPDDPEAARQEAAEIVGCYPEQVEVEK
ncbi:MAG: hypothetical protein JRD89_21035 [Deltaproteobacteria bacterium]|nr:hypothetical protein [Deltaproteobacteria bacterium]